MGTDIHIQVQGRLPDGTWEYPKIKPFPVYDEEGFDWDTDPTERNYNVFAFLAGVRNGFGFAGMHRHKQVTPMFEGRGLPDGFLSAEEDDKNRSGEAAFTGGDYWIGDHSFTWATLAELQAVPWDVECHSGGIVPPVGFQHWQEIGFPSGWSGGISGPGIVVHQDPEAYALLLREGKIRTSPDGRILDYCQIDWKWKPLVGCVFRKWVEGEVMAQIAKDYGGPENVRVLMGFDS